MRSWVAIAMLTIAGAGCSPPTQEPLEPASSSPPSSEPATSPDSSTVTFVDDFETDPFPRWEPVTKSAWAWRETASSHVFDLTKNVPLTEPVRAPFNRNLVRGLVVGDVQLDADLRSTTREYPNQSLCLFFGYQDPAHMYYVHFGREASETSNNIFIVNGKDRAPISTHATSGTAWTDRWHHARVTRDVEDGSIKVYFDDMEKPVMTAVDRTFSWGQVGIGSFDDTGQFDNFVVRGKQAQRQ